MQGSLKLSLVLLTSTPALRRRVSRVNPTATVGSIISVVPTTVISALDPSAAIIPARCPNLHQDTLDLYPIAVLHSLQRSTATAQCSPVDLLCTQDPLSVAGLAL